MVKKILIVLFALLIFSCEEMVVSDATVIKKGDPKQLEIFNKYLGQIRPSYVESTRTENISLTPTNLLELLPNIDEFKVYGTYSDSSSIEAVEIYSSQEKVGEPKSDRIFIELAAEFNALNKTTSDGKRAAVNVRGVDSGAGMNFILADLETPTAYSPSNDLWIKILDSQGAKMTKIRDKTTPNTAGIVIKKDKLDLISTNGELDVQKLLGAVTSGSFAMGYTNPFRSDTGLNFLLTILDAFANGDESAMLDPQVASAFEAFQLEIPFVAETTLQMRDATMNSGVLDAFVMEHQTFVQTTGWGEYVFIPFGILHDNPLYATEKATKGDLEVLEMFAQYIDKNAKKIKASGFSQGPAHKSTYNIENGATIVSAQKIWKDKKSGGKPIAAMFIADVSGSMDNNNRIGALKEALESASGLISSKNSIGLISYSDNVNVDLPIREFNMKHKAKFLGAVKDLDTGGSTATNNAILVGLDELMKFGERNPNHKLVCFILSDGEQTAGLALKAVKGPIKAVGIPVHAIAYDFNSQDLKDIAGLVEASYSQSSSESAAYNIGNLLNSQM